MSDGRLKGKQLEDLTISLDKLNGEGSVIFATSSSIESNGTFLLEDATFNVVRTDINLEDSNINSSTDMEINSDGDFTVNSVGEFYLNSDSYFSIFVTGDIDIGAYNGGYVSIGAYGGGNISLFTQEDISITGGNNSSINLGNTSSITLGSGTTIFMTEADVDVVNSDVTLTNSNLYVTGSGKLQVAGSATDPNDVITKKDLDNIGNLQVTDYNTGASFSNIQNIIFRGQSVLVPNPTGASADGVFVQDGGQQSVVVWIPKPTYAPYFNTESANVDPEDTTLRYVADPGSPAQYNVGDWTNFDSASRESLDSNNIQYVSTEFGVLNTNTTLDFTILDGDGITASSVSMTVATNSTTSSGLTINVSQFETDEDRYLATATFTADLDVALDSEGGRFSVIITHNNDTDGTYTFTQNNVFYDSNNNTASIGTSTVEEGTPSLKWASGIAYYDSGSSFDFTVPDIDNINDRSFPRGTQNWGNASTSNQIRLIPNNFAISNTFYAHSTEITGWTSSYDISGLTWSETGAINQNTQYVPDLNSSQNLDTSIGTNISVRTFDWTESGDINSATFSALIDTQSYSSNNTTDAVGDEANRLLLSDLNINTGSWDSQDVITDDDLQVAFDKIIWPRDNYSTYNPNINITNTRDYSSLGAPSSRNFNVYSDVQTGNSTTNESFSGFKWYATSLLLGSVANTGTLTFISNIVESDFAIEEGNNATTGDDDVVILVGHDSQNAGAATQPDNYLCLTDDFSGRTATGNSFDGSPKKISYTWGTVGNYARIWVLVGIKTTKQNRYISEISLQSGT